MAREIKATARTIAGILFDMSSLLNLVEFANIAANRMPAAAATSFSQFSEKNTPADNESQPSHTPYRVDVARYAQ
jgi:hypothetical protein